MMDSWIPSMRLKVLTEENRLVVHQDHWIVHFGLSWRLLIKLVHHDRQFVLRISVKPFKIGFLNLKSSSPEIIFKGAVLLTAKP